MFWLIVSGDSMRGCLVRVLGQNIVAVKKHMKDEAVCIMVDGKHSKKGP